MFLKICLNEFRRSLYNLEIFFQYKYRGIPHICSIKISIWYNFIKKKHILMSIHFSRNIFIQLDAVYSI